MHVETTSALKSSRVVSEKAQTLSQGNPEYELTMDARLLSADRALLSGEVATSRPCTQEVVTTSENTTAWTREATDSGWVRAGAVIGVAGASALAWGIHEHAKGKPLSETPPGKDSKEVTTVGAAVYLGGAASLLLVEALITAVRTIDTETTELVEQRATKTGRCDRAPAVGATVAIKSRGLVVAQTESDARGRYEVEVGAPGSMTGGTGLSLMVNRDEVESPESLRALDRVFSVQQRNAAAPAPPAPPTPLTPALFLYGVALKGSERSALESAITQAGGRRIVATGSKNISQFDIALLTLPGLQRMKLMFDGLDRFVQAKYEGVLAENKRQELIATLVERYGPGKEVTPGSVRSWTFDDGLALTLRLEASPKGQFSLAYVDELAKAAVREAVKNKESVK